MDQHLQQLKREADTGNPEAEKRYWQARIRAGKRILLGMSLSFCIKTILEGSVGKEEVIGIIGSTTGFVVNGKPGKNYQKLIDQRMDPYWHKFSRSEVDDVLVAMLPRITEQSHGLPGTWVDASKPHYWGWVPHGYNLGIVGDYINVETNKVCYPASLILERKKEEMKDGYMRSWWMECSSIRDKYRHPGADALNLKYGFKHPRQISAPRRRCTKPEIWFQTSFLGD